MMFRGFARGGPRRESPGWLRGGSPGGEEAAKDADAIFSSWEQKKSTENVINNTDFHRNPIENRASELL